MDNRENRWKL